MPTEMELILEQTQQGVSYEVSIPGHITFAVRNNKVLSDIEDCLGPSDDLHKTPPIYSISQKDLFQYSRRYSHLYRRSHSEFVDIWVKVASAPASIIAKIKVHY
ncbi:hypothetical protein Tco_0569499 [Tanacetum coccineum]